MNLSIFWNKHGAHALSYIASAVLVACGLATSYGGLIPKWGPVIVGVAGGAATFVHQVQQLIKANATLPAPAPSAVDKQAGNAHLNFLNILTVAALISFALIGCSTLQKVTKTVNSPTTAPLVASGVELAVGTEIALVHKTPADQAAAAARYIAIAQALEALDTGDVVTLSQLESAAAAKIDAANIPPPDKLAAKNLMAEIAAILLQETQPGAAPAGTQPLTPDMKVAVKSVLDDVILAASTYQVHARAVLHAELAPQ